MPTYEFICQGCHNLRFTATTVEPLRCPVGHDEIKRVYDFQGFHRKWDGGFSPTIGRYASNEYAVSEGLKAASHNVSEEMGMEHRYVPCDPRDLPTTDESATMRALLGGVGPVP
jgi:hypothetical protein